MLAPISHVQALTTVQRGHKLPAESEVLVQLGNQVETGQALAERKSSSQHLTLDATKALGVPTERVAEMLQREVGERVDSGAIIAGKRGFASRILRAPSDGRIAAISGGQILLEVEDESSWLNAQLPGKVSAIDSERGIVIECVCAWVQGRWGNGLSGHGLLNVLAENEKHVFTADQIDMSQRDAILFAGHCSQRKALEMAAKVPVRGLILGSLSTRLLPLARRLEVPLLILGGFGEIPIIPEVYELLSAYKEAETTLNAHTNDPFADWPPEVIIPLAEAGVPPEPITSQHFRIGQRVRLVGGPHFGQVGEINAILDKSTLFPNGLRTEAAEIALDQSGTALAPLANLELLG